MSQAISGKELRSLMRKHKKTIRQLARDAGFTQKRIREVLNQGLSDPAAARDWVQAITGSDPGLFPNGGST